MVLGRRVEIAHHVGCGRARGFVSAMFGKVWYQALQCRALALHTVVAGGKHFQRRLGSTGRRGKSWEICIHVTGVQVGPAKRRLAAEGKPERACRSSLRPPSAKPGSDAT